MSRRLTLENFIDRSNCKHRNFYGYTKTVYKDCASKVLITCPFHGDFFQIPAHHLRGIGCNECGRRRTSESHVHVRNEPFIENARKRHGLRYDYSLVNMSTREKGMVTITCNTHGPFLQKPTAHLTGRGCPRCGREVVEESIRLSPIEFLHKARMAHGSLYEYDVKEFISSSSRINITCRIHGIFNQGLSNHIYQRQGCRKCSTTTWRKENEWLDHLNIPDDAKHRQVRLDINGRKFIVDGFDGNNTLFEFFGDFWHGNPTKYNPDDINPVTKNTFGELYRATIDKVALLESMGYNLIYLWESDFDEKFKKLG